MSKEIKATVVATGKQVRVYKHRERMVYVEYPNCSVEHKPEALKF